MNFLEAAQILTLPPEEQRLIAKLEHEEKMHRFQLELAARAEELRKAYPGLVTDDPAAPKFGAKAS